MAFPLRQALQRGRVWARGGVPMGAGVIAPLIRPMLPRRRVVHRPDAVASAVSINVGTMEVRLAATPAAVDAAPALRSRILYEQMTAPANPETPRRRRAADAGRRAG